MRGKLLVLAIMAVVLPLAGGACNGGGGGEGRLSVEDLAGTWFGVMVDPVFTAHTYQFTIDPRGDMSGFYMDDVSYPTFAGTAYRESGRIFNFLMNDGTKGGFIADENGTHLAFLTENFQRGVMEKWATELPVFEGPDYQGTWNGYSIWLDAYFEIDNEGPTNFTVDSDFHVLGTGLAGAFSGTFIPLAGEPGYGVLRGTIGSGIGIFEMAPSVDRTFMATLACVVSFDIEIKDCEFGAYTKE
jgi:hypothetical protein